MFTKTVKITAPNTDTTGATVTVFLLPTGFNDSTSDTQVHSRMTKIVKFDVPDHKFGNKGDLKYENDSTSQVKFYDYHLVCYTYTNFTTSQDGFNVGLINDYFKVTYYTDA